MSQALNRLGKSEDSITIHNGLNGLNGFQNKKIETIGLRGIRGSMSKFITISLLFLLLMSVSPYAWAAETVAWKTYLLSAMSIAMVIGAFLAFRNPKAESTPAKLLLTGLYFWIITFAELIVLALLYYFTK